MLCVLRAYLCCTFCRKTQYNAFMLYMSEASFTFLLLRISVEKKRYLYKLLAYFAAQQTQHHNRVALMIDLINLKFAIETSRIETP